MLVVVTIALTASSFSTAAVGIEAVHSGSSVYFSTRTLHSHKNTHTQCKQQKQHARSLLPHPTPVRFVGMSTIRLCLREETKSKKDNLQWIFLWVNLIVAIGFCNRQPAVSCFFFTQLKLFSFFSYCIYTKFEEYFTLSLSTSRLRKSRFSPGFIV